MIGMTTNFISYCSNSVIDISKSNAFSGKIKRWKDNSIAVFSWIFSIAIRVSFVVGVDFELMETHSFSVLMSFSFKSPFMRALITLYFSVEWTVRPVLIYLRNPMLATRYVENLLKFTQV